ncbi:MAG: hypothetical protein DRJ52_09265 [Thermoprotei archaeon]|nr:MAG: hypothetical protein DRJ52_09265 [Thermoprotei archaeon]
MSFLKPKRRRIEKAARLLLKGKLVAEIEESGLSVDEALVLHDALGYLKRKFPNKSSSWYYRALIRFLFGVRQLSENTWIVKGLKNLGDNYPQYTVVYLGDRYTCDCYYRTWGARRRKEVCTHIASVILFRQFEKRLKVIKE